MPIDHIFDIGFSRADDENVSDNDGHTGWFGDYQLAALGWKKSVSPKLRVLQSQPISIPKAHPNSHTMFHSCRFHRPIRSHSRAGNTLLPRMHSFRYRCSIPVLPRVLVHWFVLVHHHPSPADY
jgi:hypothetical protein